MNKGFTLIECIMYLALFSIIIGGTVVSSYSMLETTGNNESKNILLEEGLFLESKIEWILSSVKTIETPEKNVSCNTGCSLVVVRQSPEGSSISLVQTGKNLMISYDGGAQSIVNGSNFEVSDFKAQHLIGENGKSSVMISFALSSKDSRGALVSSSFSVTHYEF